MKKPFFFVVAGIFLLTALSFRPTDIPSLMTPTPVPSETLSLDQLRSALSTFESEIATGESVLATPAAMREDEHWEPLLKKMSELQKQVSELEKLIHEVTLLQRRFRLRAQLRETTTALIIALMIGALPMLVTSHFHEHLTAIANRMRRLLGIRPREAPVAYKERIAGLVRGLEKTSAELDSIYREIAEVLGQREAAITSLQQRVEALAEQEAQLQTKVETLERVPLPAVDYFADIVQRGEKRSAWRDYSLFALGAAVSAVVSFVFWLLGN